MPHMPGDVWNHRSSHPLGVKVTRSDSVGSHDLDAVISGSPATAAGLAGSRKRNHSLLAATGAGHQIGGVDGFVAAVAGVEAQAT